MTRTATGREYKNLFHEKKYEKDLISFQRTTVIFPVIIFLMLKSVVHDAVCYYHLLLVLLRGNFPELLQN